MVFVVNPRPARQVGLKKAPDIVIGQVFGK
jgi:hypothetical protein